MKTAYLLSREKERAGELSLDMMGSILIASRIQ